MPLDTSNPRDLLTGSDLSLSELLGVDVRTIKRYKAAGALPVASMKLLQLRYGDLSGLLGDEWKGFTFGRDGKLYPPFFRGGFSAVQICAMFFERQELTHLRSEVKRLQSALDAEKDKAKAAEVSTWAASKVRQFTGG